MFGFNFLVCIINIVYLINFDFVFELWVSVFICWNLFFKNNFMMKVLMINLVYVYDILKINM